MRQIFLDTETTGLSPALGHRIIEVAAVEMLNRRLTGNHFHCYLNPEREIDAGAQQVHGISIEFLQDKPKFADVAQEFLDFVQGGELIIHNAPFDVGFLNHELSLISQAAIGTVCASVIDTLKLAKELHPGQKNNLDALCKRYFVDNSNRTMHGALLDAELLADVYIAMTRGQDSLLIDMNEPVEMHMDASGAALPKVSLRVVRASEEELAAHAALLADIDKESKGACIWNETN
ncbi:MAG: DNA polymerase III subunit epsilon [Pseudomonadota bacterium]